MDSRFHSLRTANSGWLALLLVALTSSGGCVLEYEVSSLDAPPGATATIPSTTTPSPQVEGPQQPEIAPVSPPPAVPERTPDRGRASQATPPPLGEVRRLAVLASKTLRDRGLSNLLTVQFTTDGSDGIELVERERLDAITGELQLAALFGGDAAVDKRIELGRLLRADMLLLVMEGETEESADGPDHHVRMIAVDTRTGARLGHDTFADQDDLEQTSAAITGSVRAILRHFPQGVERIVGVSHFLSRCLTHDYDAYQAGCAELLSAALAQQAGVATLEIEEARAVSDELTLTIADSSRPEAAAIRDRLVPALVSGEFVATRDGPPGSDSERFDVKVTILRGKGEPESIGAEALSRQELAAFLSTELPQRILGEREGDASRSDTHDADAQFRWLLDEADRFALFGEWKRSSGLHEAALLLEPDDTKLRFQLIREYQRQMLRRFPVPKHYAEIPPDDEIRREYRERAAFYPLILGHLEYMVRNRLVRAEEVLLGARLGWTAEDRRPPFYSYTAGYVERCIPRKIVFEEYNKNNQSYRAEQHYRKLGREALAPCHDLEARFMEQVFPLICELPTNAEEKVAAFLRERRLKPLLQPIQKPPTEVAKGQAELKRMLEADMPEGLDPDVFRFLEVKVRSLYTIRTEAARRGEDGEKAVRADPWYRYFEELTQNSRTEVRFYGQFALAATNWLMWKARWQEALREFRPEARSRGMELIEQYGPALADARPEFVKELDAIEAELQRLQTFVEEQDWPRMRGGAGVASWIREAHTFGRKQLEPPPPRREPDPIVKAKQEAWRSYWPKYEVTAPIPITIKTLDGQSRPVMADEWVRLHKRWGDAYRWSIDTRYYPIVNWRRCTPTLDVLHNDLAILVMRTPGVAEEILSRTDAVFLDVLWEGRHFWVVTKNAGLWVVSTSGEILRTVGPDDGLPPYDRGDVLYPLDEGKALMAGAFGETCRAWVALIDTGAAKTVDLLHEARALHSQNNPSLPRRTLDVGFRPTFIHVFQPEGDEPARYIVGRELMNFGPLLIDARSHEVALVPRNVPMRPALNSQGIDGARQSRDFRLFSGRGRLVVPSRAGLPIDPGHPPPQDKIPGVAIWKSPFALPGPNNPPQGLCPYGGGSLIVPLGKWLYIPGPIWYRLHRDTFEAERILRYPSMSRAGFLQTSAHYGLITATVAMDKMHVRPFRQVLIHEEPPAAK